MKVYSRYGSHDLEMMQNGKMTELKQAIQEAEFEQSMRLDGVNAEAESNAGFVPPNYRLFPLFSLLHDINLDGMTCLDMSPPDGTTAFVQAELGAQKSDVLSPIDNKRFRLIHRYRKDDKIKYFPNACNYQQVLRRLSRHALG